MKPMLVAVLMAACLCGAAVAAQSKTRAAVEPWSLRRSGYMPRMAAAANRELSRVACPEVKRPIVPKRVPEWARGFTSEQLRKKKGVKEIVKHDTGRLLEAFTKNQQVVIKLCRATTLEEVMWFTRPNRFNFDPTWDIVFDCDPNVMWTIMLRETLEFGTGATKTKGTWRLLAPHFNIILDGIKRHRIAKVLKNATLTVYGLTIQRGKEVFREIVPKDQIPTGGFGGAGILVQYRASLIAYQTRFYRNKALSPYARWSGGGAIKGETRSSIWVHSCEFDRNMASVGGAISTSSAYFLKVADSMFTGNSARGGFDMSSKKGGRTKNLILVRGGAVRIDSVTDHESTAEHVTVCNSEFNDNEIRLSMLDLVNRFKYSPQDVGYVRGQGAAFTAWNKSGRLQTVEQRFLTLKGCSFNGNTERIGPAQHRMGRYVVEVEGAGHCDVTHSEFKGNDIQAAVLKVDNSERFSTGQPYTTVIRNVKFEDNGNAAGLDFEANGHQSLCDIKNVDGIKNTKARDCTHGRR